MVFQYAIKAQVLQLQVQCQHYYIKLKPQKRRSVRLQVNTKYELELLIPNTHFFSLDKFIQTEQSWLLQQLQKQLQAIKNEQIWHEFKGVRKKIVVAEITELQETPHALLIPKQLSEIQRLQKLSQYQRQKAYALGSERLHHWWGRFHYQQNRPNLRIKKMRTRWGSMSSKHNLNLSLQLFSYPLAQIDLVLVHELCHIQHMNHSADFYALLQQHLPDWQIREQRLRQVACY